MASEWTNAENALVLQAYFHMLNCQRQRVQYSKLRINLGILAHLPGRTRPAVEFKHCNISAVLRDLGLEYVHGYKPRANYQHSLVALVKAGLDGDASLQLLAEQQRRAMSSASSATKGKEMAISDVAVPDSTPVVGTAFDKLQSRAFGGADVATRPCVADDAWWPKAPPVMGVSEVTGAFLRAVSRNVGLTLVFLLGGAGNGKSFAARDLAEKLGMRGQPAGDLARRSYSDHVGSTFVEIVNDATIAPSKDYPGLQQVALAEDIRRWESMLAQSPVAVFCCVNRGVVINEIRGLEEHDSRVSGFARAVLLWLANGERGIAEMVGGAPSPPLELIVPSQMPHFRQETIQWEGKRACVAALSVDAFSLATVEPGLGDSRAGCLFRQVIQRCAADAEARDRQCPVRANVDQWAPLAMVDCWVTLVEAAEIASGRPHSYRELWGLAALSVVGPRVVEELLPAALLAQVDGELRKARCAETAEARLAPLLRLARLRSHEALFRAPSPRLVGQELSVTFPPPTPMHNGLALVDPSVWGTGASQSVERAMQAVAVGEAPSGHLQHVPPFRAAWSPFDQVLEETIVDYVMQDSCPDSSRRKLVSWWGGYLLRLMGLVTGNLGNHEITRLWRTCSEASQNGPAVLPDALDIAVRSLLFPTAKGGPANMLIRAFAARIEPLRQRRDGSSPALVESVNHSMVAFQVSRSGNRLVLDCLRDGNIVGRSVLDFPLLRDALACRISEGGQTEASSFVEPRIERLRAATLRGIPNRWRRLLVINGGEQVEVSY
jgi:hypothetical protein